MILHRRAALIRVASASAVIAAAPSRSWAQGAEKIKVVGPQTEDWTSFFYAIKSGLFGRAGLDVEMTGANSGSAATAAVVTGSHEIAKTSLPGIFAAKLRNIPIVIVAPELLYVSSKPFALLQVPNDSNLRSGRDLDGKIVGVPALNDLNTLATRAWADKRRNWETLGLSRFPMLRPAASSNTASCGDAAIAAIGHLAG